MKLAQVQVDLAHMSLTGFSAKYDLAEIDSPG